MKSIRSLSDRKTSEVRQGYYHVQHCNILFAVVEDTDAGLVPALMTCVFPCLAKRRHDAEHYALRSFSTQKRNLVRRRLEHVNTKGVVACTYAYSTLADVRGGVVYGQRFSGPQSGPV